MPETNLTDTTITLLRHRDTTLTLAIIAKKCDVSVAWLASLLSKTPPSDPSADKIQRLYEFLSGKPLL